MTGNYNYFYDFNHLSYKKQSKRKRKTFENSSLCE